MSSSSCSGSEIVEMPLDRVTHLDAALSMCCKVSRTNAALLVDKGLVSVNGTVVSSKSLSVSVGDTLLVARDKEAETTTVSNVKQLEFHFVDVAQDTTSDVSEADTDDDITQATASMNSTSLSATAKKLTATASAYVPSWVRSSPDSAYPVVSEQQSHGSVSHAQASDRQSTYVGTHPSLGSVDSSDSSSVSLVYSIDVECVATGLGNRDRAPARAVLIDQYENVLLDRFIKPHSQVVSCLTELTGISAWQLKDAPSLEQVVDEIGLLMPQNSLLVGQGIQSDINWLGLEKGKHFKESFDVAHLFRIPRANNGFRYFSLRHEVMHLSGFEGAGLDIQAGAHDPFLDAVYAVRLYLRYHNTSQDEMTFHRTALCRAPHTRPFWQTKPTIDGVSMGGPIKKNVK